MVSRMDKYHSGTNSSIQSRSKKNENLYEELYTNKVFTEFSDINHNNIFDLDAISQKNEYTKREDYQKGKILSNSYETIPKKRNDFYTQNSMFSTDLEEKNYNINDILENAKKNRTTEDEFEQRHSLKNVEYNILSDLSQEKLKEYRDKKQKLSKDEEENLEELIHTITSNSLRKKIDNELLGDLLPETETETIISEQLVEQLNQSALDIKIPPVTTPTDNQNNVIQQPIEEDENKIDTSFYTRSMDLSEEDFDLELDQEEDHSFIELSNMTTVKKIVVVVFITLVLAIICYVIYRFL